MNSHSLGLSTGRVLITSHGSYMLIRDNSPISMGNPKNKSGLFDGLENGDEILVLHNGINESYPGKTGAYAIFKLEAFKESILNIRMSGLLKARLNKAKIMFSVISQSPRFTPIASLLEP